MNIDQAMFYRQEKIIIKTYADGEHIETFEFETVDRVKRAQSMLRTLKKIHASKWLVHNWTTEWIEV